jgi:hypothetical protein
MALIHYVTVDGQYAYIIDSLFGVRILDVSNPAQIEEVTSLSHGGGDALLSHLVIRGDRGYYLRDAEIEDKSLVILDVSDPETASQLAQYDLPGYWWFYGFDIAEDHLCIACSHDGLKVLNISDPDSVAEVCHHSAPDRTMGLAVTGDHAFISTHADSNNLLVYDISAPISPHLINELDIPGRPKWISRHEDHLYVPGVEIDLTPGVIVMDISTPSEPESIAFWMCPSEDLGLPMNVVPYEDYAIMALAYGGVQILDVSQIDQPVALGSWTLWDIWTNIDFAVLNVAVSWPFLFLPDQAYGLYVLDASDPADLEQVASYQTSGQAWWVDLSPDERHLYLADNTGGLLVFDVSNPESPALVEQIQTGLQNVSHVLSVGDSIYVADGRGVGLRVYDVTDPAAPREVAYHETPGIYITAMAWANGLVYAADDTHFEIFEMTGGGTDVEPTPANEALPDAVIRSVSPNPFNASTRILFDLAESGHVSLQVYNVTGQMVRTLADGFIARGRHSRLFEADNLASGIYFVCLQHRGRMDVRKAVLVK